jgi:hypothetical protein
VDGAIRPAPGQRTRVLGAQWHLVDVGRKYPTRLDPGLLQEFDAAWRPGGKHKRLQTAHRVSRPP